MEKERSFFSKQLKNIMFEKGISQKDLSDKLEVSYTVVSRWVNGGRNPELASIKRIAKALDVPFDYFLEKETDTADKNEDLKNKNFDLIIKLIDKQNKMVEEKMKRYEAENNLLRNEIRNIKKTLNNPERK